MKKKHMETALIHHGYTSEEHKGSLTPPLFQTSTFTFENLFRIYDIICTKKDICYDT
ncbi:hypothetical protein [Bacillus paranthracis]|uniref:hypothetical protein n=1 Tax=Bacillus paranthracis TaxID=2026186 RepID=UPI0039A31FC9